MTAGGGGQYTDSWAGFTVQRPAGWLVRVANSVVTVNKDSAELVHAIFCPMRFAQSITPDAAAQRFIGLYRATDPTFQAWVASQEPLVLRTEAQGGGRTLDGIYSVVTQGENGLISGFQAPRDQVQSLAPVLGQVVGSFSVLPRIPREQFREPVEGAFTVLYPQGWSATEASTEPMHMAGLSPALRLPMDQFLYRTGRPPFRSPKASGS